MKTHEHKLNMELRPIKKSLSEEIVKRIHQSNTLPKTTKYALGVYIDDVLEGTITLGYGTRPKHTIKKMFPSLDTKDYLEIGRMCINNDFKTNTESQMLSKTMKWVKRNLPHIKLIFTWANGLLGKIGTVYQASNFLYGGYIITECYVIDGYQLHPRGFKQLYHPNDPRKTVKPNAEEKKKYGITHIKGKQFRYVYFTCGYSERNRLVQESEFEWNTNYPRLEDCSWRKWVGRWKWVDCEKPVIKSDSLEDFLTNREQSTLGNFI